ncbi:MAG: hypothetical protein QXN87_08885 [Candidatus Bathyarchaeia archaeon]
MAQYGLGSRGRKQAPPLLMYTFAIALTQTALTPPLNVVGALLPSATAKLGISSHFCHSCARNAFSRPYGVLRRRDVRCSRFLKAVCSVCCFSTCCSLHTLFVGLACALACKGGRSGLRFSIFNFKVLEPSFSGLMLVDMADPADVLREVRRVIEKNGMASLSELERALGVSRNWLSGFMAALEALGIVDCRGTKTYKLYMVKQTS